MSDRDPDRIDPIIEDLRSVWKSMPDLRLGQILAGAVLFGDPNETVFYIEDEKLAALLKNMAETTP